LYQAHIEDTDNGLHLKKSNVFEANLSDLVAFYRTNIQMDLPCPLR